MRIIQRIRDWIRGTGRLFGGVQRSPKWSSIRKDFLILNPTCRVCGGKKKLNVHHIVAYHTDKSKELDPLNLITLCEKHDCHFIFGHLGSYLSINPNVVEDAKVMNYKIINRK